MEVFPASDTLFFNLSNEEYVFSRTGEAPTLTWRGSFGELTATRCLVVTEIHVHFY